jgi:hypothetical protein
MPKHIPYSIPVPTRREELITQAKVEIPDVTVSVIDTYIKNRDETSSGAPNLNKLSDELMNTLKKAYPDVELSMLSRSDYGELREIPQYADYESYSPHVIFNAKQTEKAIIAAKRWKWIFEREEEEWKRKMEQKERAGPLINLNATPMNSATNTNNAAIAKRMYNFKNLQLGGYRKSSHIRRRSKHKLSTRKQRR